MQNLKNLLTKTLIAFTLKNNAKLIIDNKGLCTGDTWYVTCWSCPLAFVCPKLDSNIKKANKNKNVVRLLQKWLDDNEEDFYEQR